MINSISGNRPIDDISQLQPAHSVKQSAKTNTNEQLKQKEDVAVEEKPEKAPNNDLQQVLENEKPEQKPDYKEFANKFKQFLNQNDLTIEFSMDEDTDKMIMKVIDNDTKKIIHQYPPDVALKIAKLVSNTMDSGYFTNVKV